MALDYLPWHLATQYADRPAINDDSADLTFAEYDQRTEAAAALLRKHGFGAGDVLGVMLSNRIELVVAIGAAWRLGGVATPINPAFTATEARHQLDDSGAAIVLVEQDVTGLRQLTIHVDDVPTERTEVVEPHPVHPDDLALLIYTSGSTGRPKGVMLDHRHTDAMTSTMVEHFGLTADDHCMLILPLFHVNALMVSTFAPLRVGGRLSIIGRFSPGTFFDELERLRPTYFSAVPTIYALLAALPAEREPDTSSLRFVVCGAAPVTRELLQECERRFGFVMVEGYGLTEGTCASACNPVDGVRKLGSVGPALPGITIRVVNEDGQDVPTGESGQVLISGDTVMRGYLNRPEATAQTVVDGWLHTGDIGRLDSDGYLSIVDRVKDMIIRGGENLYPKEIESTIAQVDGVLEVAVVGRPDPVLGEVPVAWVVAYPGSGLSTDIIEDHCRAHLTRVKVPADIRIVEALPKNPVGKIDKPAMRASLSAGALPV